MALHVPKAPGFAQMLKEGAKVRPPVDGCADKWTDGCGSRVRAAVRGKPREACRAGRHHVFGGAGAGGALALRLPRPGPLRGLSAGIGACPALQGGARSTRPSRNLCGAGMALPALPRAGPCRLLPPARGCAGARAEPEP